MKIAVAIAGLLAGALAGIVLVLVNPIAERPDAHRMTGTNVVSADFVLPEFRGMRIEPGVFLGTASPDGRVGLADPALEYARGSVALLSAGETLPPALAVKLTVLANDNAILAGRLATTSTWNLVWPGEGSIFLVGSENYWPLLSGDALARLPGVARRSGPVSLAVSSVGANRSGQLLLGAGGRFGDARGRFEETATFPPGETNPVGGELRLRFDAN